MKQLGNMLTKKKEHNVAKRVYGYALDITPDSDTGLKRDLLSNRSYMSELLGYPDAAINDAKKCLQMCSDWPKVLIIFLILFLFIHNILLPGNELPNRAKLSSAIVRLISINQLINKINQ